MSFGITITGFNKKTYSDIKSELEAIYLGIWPTADLDSAGPIGQQIALSAKREADIWDAMQEVYLAMDARQARGTTLSSLYSLVGVTRIDSAPSTAKVYHFGANGTLIPTDTLIKQGSTGKTFRLVTAVTIASATPHAMNLTPAAPTTGKLYRLVAEGLTTSWTAPSGATMASTLAGFATALRATYGATAIVTTVGESLLILKTDGTTFTYTSNLGLTVIPGVLGNYSCTIDGTVPIPAMTLDTIMTPISGWSSVWQPDAGQTGRDSENDADFRARASNYFANGRGTADAIRQGILNNVAGVSACQVISNRSSSPLGTQPGNSFQVVVTGGDEQAIADLIWAYQPAGIQSFGAVSKTVVDSEGESQIVKFTRPGRAYIWVKVRVAKLVNYPLNCDAQIRTNIVNWALAYYYAGAVVYRRALVTPINLVLGIGDVEVLLGDTTDGTDPGTDYFAQDITTAPTDTPNFDQARIIVEEM